MMNLNPNAAKFIARQAKLQSKDAEDKADNAVEVSDEAKSIADDATSTAIDAKSTADEALDNSETTQQQLDDIILENGDSEAEVVQARGNEDLLYKRLDKTDEQLAEKAHVINVHEYSTIEGAITKASELKDDATKPVLLFSFKGDFQTSDTISIPSGINVIMEKTLIYTGSNDEPALIVGEPGKSNKGVKINIKVKRDSLSDWTDESSVGVRIINSNACDINIAEARGFTIGAQLIGSDGGFAYSEIHLGDIQDNKFGLDCTNEGSEGLGWFNENVIVGGRFWCSSSANTSLSRYGVRITSNDENYTNNNSNFFLKPSFELREPDDGEAIPLLIEHGNSNTFENCRNENNSDTFARFLNESTENTVTSGYGYIEIEDESKYPSNHLRSIRNKNEDNMNNLIFHSGDLQSKTFIYNETDERYNVAGMFLCGSVNSNINKSHTSITVNDRSITLGSSRAVGIRVDTSQTKKFVVRRDVSESNPGRASIRCWDENLDILYDEEIDYVKGKSSTTPTRNSNFGGVYRMGAESQSDFYFVVNDDVKFIDVLCGDCDISSFSIYTDENISTAFNPLTNTSENLATEPPTTGEFKRGKILYNDNSLSTGDNIGWINVEEDGCDFRTFGEIN
ncbi:hypothetical protein [Halobacillus sp. A5]|uniref:hypothetical protein n=1 Tax=Halobacillus sp. A5 TaxID=2880263 RepID=UPI0020A6D602|nr:hypothetical protein [Halobacillus sp. A5]MCP3025421.1 hypothetical protein [Halobacillus sp. A5]